MLISCSIDLGISMCNQNSDITIEEITYVYTCTFKWRNTEISRSYRGAYDHAQGSSPFWYHEYGPKTGIAPVCMTRCGFCISVYHYFSDVSLKKIIKITQSLKFLWNSPEAVLHVHIWVGRTMEFRVFVKTLRSCVCVRYMGGENHGIQGFHENLKELCVGIKEVLSFQQFLKVVEFLKGRVVAYIE